MHASLATKPCPEFNFCHKFSILVLGPTQSGKKPILFNKFWNIIVSCTKSKRVLAFFGTTINGKNRYEKLNVSRKKHLVKFERGVAKLSEDLSEINPRYNRSSF